MNITLLYQAIRKIQHYKIGKILVIIKILPF